MSSFVGIIASIEDDDYQGKAFKKVTLGDGHVLKVKYGQKGYLKDKWDELEVNKAYTWTMGSYNDKPFVQDFQKTDMPELGQQEPTHKVEPEGMPPAGMRPSLPTPNPPTKYKADPDKTNSIEIQVSMKLILEAWIAGKLEDDDPLVTAWINWCGDKSSAWK